MTTKAGPLLIIFGGWPSNVRVLRTVTNSRMTCEWQID